jgi:putative MATE family efflux protein
MKSTTTEIRPKRAAKFTTGSTMRHVISMTVAGATGLMAIFLVDIANLFYIAQLGDQVLTAAIGYGATIMFFSISLSIGLAIAATALTARAIGSDDSEQARKVAASSLLFVIIINIAVAAGIFMSLEWFLTILGAKGRTFDEALKFIQIVTLSSPLMGIAMCQGGILRAEGDAKRAMFVTLAGGIAAAILDPILIFGFDLEILGAAIATLLSRVVMVIVGYIATQRTHDLVGRIEWHTIGRQAGDFVSIAGPAVVTQLATPVGNAYVTSTISTFGDDAIAGWTIIGRLMPMAFGVLFSLSGAVGPIIAQNLGARYFDRISQTMRDAFTFTIVYTLFAWALLVLFRGPLVAMFDATGDAALLVEFFCLFVAGSFLFNGALFVANAAFNNLGNPLLATFFNWGRATLGVIPFVYIGKAYGAEGVLAGWGLGAVFFGILSVIVSFRVVARLPQKHASS